jgi:signal transduction histidine kinase
MDITQLKSMMKEIIEKNKRLEYIANIHSHKIRAPLARVLGLMHLLQIDAQHLSEYLDMLKTECHRLDSIVHEILNLTYIEE